MYRFLRNTHLLLGLFFCSFVLVYAVSSISFAHGSWLPEKRNVTEMELTISHERDPTPRDLARELMNHYGIRGGMLEVTKTPVGFDFYIGRIGTAHGISYNAQTGQVRIRKTAADFMGTLIWMHEYAGLKHEYWLNKFWGLCVVLVCSGLLALGVTGIYLWFKIHDERLVGSVLLALGLSYGLGLMALIWTT